MRQQAYVFAKGILEDGGFAWRVEGPVEGYAANTVASQNPAPGTKVMDTGEPTVVLHLAKNPSYAQNGLPENKSPRTRHRRGARRRRRRGARAGRGDRRERRRPSARRTPARRASGSKNQKPAKPKKKTVKVRKPAFVVPGAPAEPLDEMPLPQRARLLQTRLAGKPKPTPALVNLWLYQHAWLVTGAQFGWSGGAEALRTLVQVDQDLQARWNMGAKSAAVAAAALAEVERRSAK